jgi:hypothetical protein
MVRQAFHDAIPARQDAFKDTVAKARKEKDHRMDMKGWYPAEVLRLAKEEARTRVDMAGSRIHDLLDSGWEPTQMLPVRSVFSNMFSQYDSYRKDAYRDLEHAVENAVREVAGLPPSDQPGDTKATMLAKEFSQCWVDTSQEHISNLECYMPKKAIGDVQPTIPHARALAAIRKQLQALSTFRARAWDEAESEETGWEHLTQSIIEGTFGKPSSNLDKFFAARWAGEHNIGGMPPHQLQQNFDLRVKRYEVLLRSIIDELKLYLPEDAPAPEEEHKIQAVYAPGEAWKVYRDLSLLIAKANKEVLVVDAYINEEVFNLHVDKVPDGITVKILTDKLGLNVETVARKYALSKSLLLRSSNTVHDRALFVDERGWVLGQSIKDAAKTKPTSVIELTEPDLSRLRDQYHKVWDSATVVI